MIARDVLLSGLCDEAEAAWPEFRIPRDSFLVRLETLLPQTSAFRPTEVFHIDLYLASACSAGEPAAITAFSRRYLSRLESYLSRFSDFSALFDEVRATLEDKLLLSTEGGSPPRIHQYTGRGSLEAWVAMAAQRRMLSVLRANGRAAQSNATEDLWDVWLAASGMERDQSLRFAETIKETLRRIIQSLPVRQRTILRLSIVEDVSLSQIARMLKVHQSTVSRAFHSSLGRINEELRSQLKAAHRVGDSEAESLVRELRGRIDLSLSGVFAEIPELATR
jgi:RNA polymerase sigma-70 factor (ECF subfamily)